MEEFSAENGCASAEIILRILSVSVGTFTTFPSLGAEEDGSGRVLRLLANQRFVLFQHFLRSQFPRFFGFLLFVNLDRQLPKTHLPNPLDLSPLPRMWLRLTRLRLYKISHII